MACFLPAPPEPQGAWLSTPTWPPPAQPPGPQYTELHSRDQTDKASNPRSPITHAEPGHRTAFAWAIPSTLNPSPCSVSLLVLLVWGRHQEPQTSPSWLVSPISMHLTASQLTHGIPSIQLGTCTRQAKASHQAGWKNPRNRQVGPCLCCPHYDA